MPDQDATGAPESTSRPTGLPRTLPVSIILQSGVVSFLQQKKRQEQVTGERFICSGPSFACFVFQQIKLTPAPLNDRLLSLTERHRC